MDPPVSKEIVDINEKEQEIEIQSDNISNHSEENENIMDAKIEEFIKNTVIAVETLKQEMSDIYDAIAKKSNKADLEEFLQNLEKKLELIHLPDSKSESNLEVNEK